MTSSDFDAHAFRNFEQTGWNTTANLYDEHFGHHTLRYCPALLDAAGVREGMRVLDVACGPGYVTAAAAERGTEATGVDFAPNMVAEARRLHEKARFDTADAEALPFEDGRFDAVVMGFGMLHMARPEIAAGEAFRVLRPGGRFAFSVWGEPERTAVGIGVVLNAMTNHGNPDVGIPEGPPMFRFSEHGASKQLLEGAGFIDPNVEDVALTWTFGSPEAIFHAFMEAGVRAGVALRRQTDEALDAIVAEVRERAQAYHRGGSYVFPMGAVIASGMKPEH